MFAASHRRRGNECRWITFFESPYEYDKDLCFNLIGMPDKGWVTKLRDVFKNDQSSELPAELTGNPPFWSPSSKFESLLHNSRDYLNSPRIRKCLIDNQLNDYDIYHFEQGIDPFRDGRWVKYLSAKRKGIVAFYHDTDLRDRGEIRSLQQADQINLPTEFDLLNIL